MQRVGVVDAVGQQVAAEVTVAAVPLFQVVDQTHGPLLVRLVQRTQFQRLGHERGHRAVGVAVNSL